MIGLLPHRCLTSVRFPLRRWSFRRRAAGATGRRTNTVLTAVWFAPSAGLSAVRPVTARAATHHDPAASNQVADYRCDDAWSAPDRFTLHGLVVHRVIDQISARQRREIGDQRVMLHDII